MLVPPTHTPSSEPVSPPCAEMEKCSHPNGDRSYGFREVKCLAQKYLLTFNRTHHSMRLSGLAAESVGLQEQILHKNLFSAEKTDSLSNTRIFLVLPGLYL